MSFVTLTDFFNNYRIKNGKQPNETVLNIGLMRLKRETRQLQSYSDMLMSSGLNTWSSSTYYEKDEFVQYDAGSGVQYWRSLVDQNVNIAPGSGTNWQNYWVLAPMIPTSGGILAVTVSGATTTLDLSQAKHFVITINQNTTITFSNTPAFGSTEITLDIVQDATGGWTPTLPAGTLTPGGSGIAWSTAANAHDRVRMDNSYSGTWSAFPDGIGMA